MVTSNHCPRLTVAGATIFGVCLGSTALRSSLYSGVNWSSWPARAPDVRARAMMAQTAPAANQRPALIMALSLRKLDLTRPPPSCEWCRGAGADCTAWGDRRRAPHPWPFFRCRAGASGGGELGKRVDHPAPTGPVARGRRHPRLAVVGLQEVIGLAGEEVPDDLPVELVVFDEGGSLLLHTASVASATRKGIAKWNVEPRPGSLSTQMRPPWSSTKVLVMLRPSPVPPNSRLMLAST